MTHHAAIVILTDIAQDMAAVYRGLDTAREFVEAGDDVTIVFDGSGTESLAALTAENHQLHGLLEKLRPVCAAPAATAPRHTRSPKRSPAGFELLTENRGHASLRNLVVEGRTVLTF